MRAYQAAGYDFVKIHETSRWWPLNPSRPPRVVGLPYAGRVPDAGTLDWALQTGYASLEHLHAYAARLTDSGPGPARSPYSGLVRNGAVSAGDVHPLDLARIPALTTATARADVWVCPKLAAKMMVDRTAPV